MSNPTPPSAPGSSPRDWSEDLAHENGHYFNHCHVCGVAFFGHKRRVTCKLCASPTTADELDMDEVRHVANGKAEWFTSKLAREILRLRAALASSPTLTPPEAPPTIRARNEAAGEPNGAYYVCENCHEIATMLVGGLKCATCRSDCVLYRRAAPASPPELDRAILSEAAAFLDAFANTGIAWHGGVASFREMAAACRRAAAVPAEAPNEDSADDLRTLEKAAVRFELLAGRFRGCERAKHHALSIEECEAFEVETREAFTRISAKLRAARSSGGNPE